MTQLQILFIVMILLATPLTVKADHRLPVDGAITSPVGWRLDPFGSGRAVFNRGIDIAVPNGTPVRATRKDVSFMLDCTVVTARP